MSPQKNFITIHLNGEEFYLQFVTYFTISDLLKFFDFNKSLVVMEYNGKICNPSLWSTTIIQNRDRFDIVTIVGGG